MKRITAIITVITMLFTMSVPAWALEIYVAVSVNKPISALASPEKGNPENANDDSDSSYYRGDTNYSPNALTIDLEMMYVLDHVITDVSDAATSSVYVSNDSEFSTYIELTCDRTDGDITYYSIPSQYANAGYRYVRYNFTTTTWNVRVRNFQAYAKVENAGDTYDNKNITVLPVGAEMGDRVITAFFNGSRMINAGTAIFNGTRLRFKADEDYTSAKVMVWDSLYGMKPTLDFVTIE